MICNIELNQVTFSRGLTPTNTDVGVLVEHFSKKKNLENKNLSNLTQQKEMKTTVKYFRI